jgi:hypothetical protein
MLNCLLASSVCVSNTMLCYRGYRDASVDVIKCKRADRRLVGKTTHEAQEHTALVGRWCISQTVSGKVGRHQQVLRLYSRSITAVVGRHRHAVLTPQKRPTRPQKSGSEILVLPSTRHGVLTPCDGA